MILFIIGLMMVFGLFAVFVNCFWKDDYDQ